MRVPRPALALAAAVAIALGPDGCKPSSLTPLGIDERDYTLSGVGINGVWRGSTSAGGSVAFQVADNQIFSVTLTVPGGCEADFPSFDPAPVEDGAFSVEVLDGNDRFVIEGRFASEAECSGTFLYELHSIVGGCESSGSGSFVATKAL